MDKVVTKVVFAEGDFNCHVGCDVDTFVEVDRDFGIGQANDWGQADGLDSKQRVVFNGCVLRKGKVD